MRWLLPFVALGAACSDSTPPATADAAVDAAGDGGPMCVPLGMPRARTVQPTARPLDDTLRMNHIQMKGTHNSYHVRSPPPALQLQDWNYTMATLDVQLDQQGVRALELDLHWNPYLCRYEIYHLGTIDDGTTCRRFTDCLSTIRTWSDAHPSHHPLFIHLEPKDDYAASVFDARIAAMDAEILSVFPRELVVTPDEVRGSAATLAGAIRTNGWPTLRTTRGRVLFYIDRHDAYRTAYTHTDHDLNGRLAFIDSEVTDPFAGIMVINDAARVAQIQAAVRANFIVRVLSYDAVDLNVAHSPTVVLPTGAQIISTDYPVMAPGIPQWLDLVGGTPSLCDPVGAPGVCTPRAIEAL